MARGYGPDYGNPGPDSETIERSKKMLGATRIFTGLVEMLKPVVRNEALQEAKRSGMGSIGLKKIEKTAYRSVEELPPAYGTEIENLVAMLLDMSEDVRFLAISELIGVIPQGYLANREPKGQQDSSAHDHVVRDLMVIPQQRCQFKFQFLRGIFHFCFFIFYNFFYRTCIA